MNDSSPVPVDIVDVFLNINPISLQELWYKVSVIAVCQNKCIKGDVLRLLMEKGPRETLIPSVRKTLIPFAIKSENINVLNVLIEFFPWALSETIETNYEIPLHICVSSSPELISLMLRQGILHNVGGNGKVGGLFVENIYGESLFDNLIAAMSVSEQLDRHSRIQKWKRLEVCIMYANLARERSSDGSVLSNPTKICFSCLGFIPSHLVDEALDFINFEFELEDTYNFIDMATSNDEWKGRLGLEIEDYARIIRHLIKLSSAQVYATEYSKDLLHYAAKKGLRWDCLKEILQSNYDALTKMDYKTNLMPFMVAASGLSYDLDVIYRLLRSDPLQVQIMY